MVSLQKNAEECITITVITESKEQINITIYIKNSRGTCHSKGIHLLYVNNTERPFYTQKMKLARMKNMEKVCIKLKVRESKQ